MEKIYILGNNECEQLKMKIGASMIEFPSLDKTDCAIHKYIIETLVTWDFDKLVIDLTDNAELGLMIALHMRLSLNEMWSKALCPILFVSNGFTIDSYLQYGMYSQIFLTKGAYFSSIQDAEYDITEVEGLTYDTYKPKFLDIIHIEPNATMGRHSLANQWGASVLAKVLGINALENNKSVRESQQTLYFKYIVAQIFDYRRLTQMKDIRYNQNVSINKIDATGKRILLIDDEADKGWSDVLRNLFIDKVDFDVINEKVPDYDSFSDEVKCKIEKGDFDLFFLDLRMNGNDEEGLYKPEAFSGMKILKKIKSFNKGNQVIMFTASNKAWNLKALLDEGADGYYIKESPEYAFSQKYSESNALAFCKSIEYCLRNGYLRNYYTKIKAIKELILVSDCFGDKTDEILSNMDIAYDLLIKSDGRSEYKAYSYLQLFLVIEEYTKIPSVIDETNSGLYLYNKEIRYRILKNRTLKNGNVSYDSIITMENGHYRIKKGYYNNRFIDTNFLISALLIYKFGKENSSAQDWTKIYKARNQKAAHPKSANIINEDLIRILNFMLFFFDEKNAIWKNPNHAFPDISEADQLNMLKNKFNNKK